jgi:uncharacterized protein (TIGR02145 family)
MKRYLAFPALIAVFSLISACSSSTDLAAADNSDDGTSVASSGSTKSADSKTPTSSGDSVVVVDSTKINKVVDSTKVYISANSNVENPYYSSAIAFCWDEGCEANLPSSSSKAKSSSSSGGGASIDTPSEEPPTIEGTTMTDNRNKKTYPLVTVGGKLWMAKDLNYAFGQSMCFNNEDSNCEKYGRLYTFNAAQSACPKGWKLPSREEAQALINDASYTWSYSGRCKGSSDCGFTGEMGFHWTNATPQDGDKNFEDNKGDSYAVIIVEKEPGYAGDNDQKFFQVDEKSKHFSVRCVQE